MACNKSDHEPHGMNAVAKATFRVKRMHMWETHGYGDDDRALERLETFSGVGFWTLKYLKHGYAKTIEADLSERIRQAYFSYVERKVRVFQSELAVESSDNADDGILEAEAEVLAAKIAAAKARRLIARGRR